MSKLAHLLDRTSYIDTIKAEIGKLGRKNRNILVYYGEPQLTWQLGQTLHRKFKDEGRLCALVDGEGLQANAETPLEEGLKLLCQQLRTGNIDFSCYDIAYWCYWMTRYPELAIDSVEFSKQMSRAEKLSAIADLVGAVQALDLSGVLKQMQQTGLSETARALILEMLKDVGPLIEQVIPPGVFFAKLPWFLVGLSERYRIWWKERGNQDLQELKECDSPFEMLPKLPLFLARDLKQHFRRSDLSESQQTAVIFVDRYDCLSEPNGQQCGWLEAMLEHSESSPYILWVITTNAPLPWMSDAQQLPVVPVTTAESVQALEALGLQDQQVSQEIAQAAQGSPFLLENSFQSWQRLQRKRPFNRSEFRQQLAESLRQEESGWTVVEQQLRQLLAIPRYWNQPLCEDLVAQFLSDALAPETVSQKLEVLCESPYVLSSGDGNWRWRPRLRERLLSEQSTELKAQVSQWLFERYRIVASDPPREMIGLSEAIYHGLNAYDSKAAIDWFLSAVLEAIEKRPHPTLPTIIQSLLGSSNLSAEQTALTYTRLGQAFLSLYEWEAAQSALETAIEQWREVQQLESLAASDSWYALSQVCLALNNSFDSLVSAQSAARIQREQLGEVSFEYAASLGQQAQAYFAQDRLREAQRVSDQALKIATSLPDIELLQLGELKRIAVLVCCDLNTLDEAEKRCLELLRFCKQLPASEEHDLTIHSTALLGNIYSHMGKTKWQRAFDCYQRVVDSSEMVWGVGNSTALSVLDAQVALLRKSDQFERADELASIRESSAGFGQFEETIAAAASNNRIGMALLNRGKYGKAEPLLRRALLLHQRLLGDRHPDTAQGLNNLAGLYESQGRYGEAEPLLVEALEICKAELGDRHPDTATGLNNLAGLYRSQGRYGEAEPLYVEALEIWKAALGDRHPDTAQGLNNLAGLYESQGRYGEAEPLYVEALEIRKAELGDRHPDTASSLNNLAELYRSQGRYGEAEPLYVEALEIWKAELGDRHPSTASSLNNLALLYYSQGRYGEAELLYIEALEIWKAELGDRHPSTASSLNNLAELYRSQGRYGEAEPLYVEALEIRKAELGDRHPNTATSLNNLAGLYRSQGRYVEAEPLYVEALEISKSELGDRHPDTAGSLFSLAVLYHQTERHQQALLLIQDAIAIYLSVLGADHPNTQAAQSWLQPIQQATSTEPS